jgi:hypothetical protein
VPWWSFAALLVTGVGLFRLDPLHLPPHWTTVGDLARAVAHTNYGALAAEGGRVRAGEIWDVLREIAAGQCNLRSDTIGRDTEIVAASWRDLLAA